MIEKPKRPKKIDAQDRQPPRTIDELLRRYDLDNIKIYEFLDYLINCLNKTGEDIKNNFNQISAKIDGIIESGSNSNGSYVKFNDGTMICYGIADFTIALDIAFGAAYRSDVQTINLPANYIDTNYRVDLQPVAPLHVGYLVDKTVSTFRFFPVSFTTQASSTKNVEFTAIGKWK